MIARDTVALIGKRAISVRDGFQEYLGSEIGKEPLDKIFKVYRSPATIFNSVDKFKNLPITIEHINEDEPINSVGHIDESKLIDHFSKDYDSTVAVENILKLSKEALNSIKSGVRELSLGYSFDLIEGEKYDYEMKNLNPHHLAIVERGRCGGICRVNDGANMEKEKEKKVEDENEKESTEEVKLTLGEILEMIKQLPEAVKDMSAEELDKIVPVLQEVMAIHHNESKPVSEQLDEEEKAKDEDEDEDEKKAEDEDEDEKEKAKDCACKTMKATIQKANDSHAQVLLKAQNLLPSDFNFMGKSTSEIMAAAVRSQSKRNFAIDEIPVAFKLLNVTGDFGIKETIDPLDSLRNK